MTQVKASTANGEPDSVSTPEGDEDFAPAQPLSPDVVESSVEGMQTPRGGAPAAYDADSDSEMKKVVDEISRGKLMP